MSKSLKSARSVSRSPGGSAKKSSASVERRRTERSERSSSKKASAAPKKGAGKGRVAAAAQSEEKCHHCQTGLENRERALFVEEEIGRVFCSEECISEFFAPEVERLEKEYLRRLSPSDLTGDEKEKLAHLRWVTLEEPDEIWREKTLSGDHRYTLISEFRPGNRPVWCVCICLFLRGEPSFLYLAFPTKNAAMVNAYRKGERVQWEKPTREQVVQEAREAAGVPESDDPVANGQVLITPSGPRLIDGLADNWTEDETRRAQLVQHRRRDDIPADQYEQYQGCMEETLEAPDEVWTLQLDEEERKGSTDPLDQLRIYHFVRQYPADAEGAQEPGYWYVIVARETENEEEIEILDAFPTRDGDLVENYRRGTQEVGHGEPGAQGRLVH